MMWMATAGEGWLTVRGMVAEAVRACASVTVTGRESAPVDVVVTVGVKEKVPSPLSVKDWVALPPMRLRSPLTVMPVLAGEVAAVTVTVRTVVWPAVTVAGLARPDAVSEPPVLPKEELRGLGAPVAKSVPLLLVSAEGVGADVCEGVARGRGRLRLQSSWRCRSR